MKWEGLDDGETAIGATGPNDATGVSFIVDGELRRRAGLTQLAAHGGIALGGFRSPLNGAWVLVVKSTGDIESVALT